MVAGKQRNRKGLRSQFLFKDIPSIIYLLSTNSHLLKVPPSPCNTWTGDQVLHAGDISNPNYNKLLTNFRYCIKI